VFYRAVDPRHRALALDGSRVAGRYSSPTQPALYLSASPEGVEAAMIAHRTADSPPRQVLAFEVEADCIFDLRNHRRCSAVGIDPADAQAPWQDTVAQGREPPSWRVANRLRDLGAHGLIDPSRKAPGLWHLVLFRWNAYGAPRVTAV
jgi:RES domain-containing protein